MDRKVIAIVSTAGTVGKTLLAAHCFYPRMSNPRVLAVDTANHTAAHFGIPVEVFSGKEFHRLFSEIMDETERDMIIDVGGSKEGVEFISGMRQAKGESEITHFVVPAMPEFKDQDAAMRTIDLLLSQKVDHKKIKVVFMKYERKVDDEFDHLLRGMEFKSIPVDLKASIEFTPLFDLLTAHSISLSEMVNDKTDYKEKMLTHPKGSPEREKCIDLRIAQGSAEEVNANLQRVFDSLFSTNKKSKG
ncbi:MAG: hypothetical protein PHT57_09170 [Rhodoferax sp.]|nr:hypothetical protein [Rhodoferax sp.]